MYFLSCVKQQKFSQKKEKSITICEYTHVLHTRSLYDNYEKQKMKKTEKKKNIHAFRFLNV